MNSVTLSLLLHISLMGRVSGCAVVREDYLSKALEQLVGLNLVEVHGEVARPTERGRAHIRAILLAPLPEQKWVSAIPEVCASEDA